MTIEAAVTVEMHPNVLLPFITEPFFNYLVVEIQVKLYLDTIRATVLKEIGTSLPFVSSSPSRGTQTEVPYTQLWGAAQSEDYGDVSARSINSEDIHCFVRLLT